MASPDPKRQQQYQQQGQQTPPEYTTADFFGKTPSIIPQDINWKNAPEIEEWLNNLKPKFFQYLENNKFNAASSANLFTNHLMNYLTLYRGELVGHYLSEGAWETIFSALGPIGNMMRFAYTKDYQWKMKWMTSPLNPNAIYYYLHALPAQKAFEIALMPVKGMVAILAHGGGPFTKASYYDYFEGKTKEKYFFTPVLRAIQASHILADGIDKFNGLTFDKSKYHSWMEQTNAKFNQAMGELKIAKESGSKKDIKQARKNLKFLINQYDGFYRFYTDKSGKRRPVSELPFWRRAAFGAAGTSRAVIRKALSNTARRLRSTERDPISFLLSLIAGSLWDFTLGLALNTIKMAGLKALNLIPGFAGLRAQVLEFVSSNRWLQAARIGGISGSAFLKGVVSPTTFASGYLGFQLGNALFPNSPMGIAWTTGITGGLGAFYNTSLKLAAIPEAVNWTQTFQDLRMAANSETFARPYAQQILEQNYIRGGRAMFAKGYGLEGFSLRPGPFMRFASWLNRNWLVRLPINGFAWRGILLDALPPEILSIKILGITLGGIINWLPAIDYFWQIKGGLARLITQPTWKIFGKTVTTPYFRFFSLQNPSSFMSSVVQKLRFQWLKIAYGEPAGFLYQETWLHKYIINPFNATVKAIKPWTTNFFNPGFFMGFGISQYLVGLGWNPITAYIVGPVAGSIGWNLGAYALQRTFGVGIASMSRINAVGWSGYLVGSLLEILIPGAQPLLPFLTSMTFIGVDIALALAGKSLIGLIAQGIGSIVTAFSGIAAGTAAAAATMAVWATITSIAMVAGLTVFFAYTIYAGFWVPMIEEAKAGPESSNFSINTDIQETAPGEYRLCSNFSIKENVFNSQKYLIHKFDFQDNYLTVDLSDPGQITDAFRGQPLDYVLFEPDSLTPNDYTIPPPEIYSPIIGYQQIPSILETYLSTPTNQAKNLKELMTEDQSVVYSMKSFFDILTNLAEEYGQTKHLIPEYQAQLELIKAERGLVEGVSNRLRSGDFEEAAKFARNYSNPLTDPCPDETVSCPDDKQGLKQLYNSWAGTTGSYANRITYLQGQTNPPLENYLADLETTIEGLKQQEELLPGIISQMLEIQRKINSQGKADDINDANFTNYYNLTPEEQDNAWQLLKDYFPKVFDESSDFYFIPQGTRYEVCVDAEYCKGPDPTIQPTCPIGEPLTVCSTISYQPSFWGPNTGFAKHCATFTPQ